MNAPRHITSLTNDRIKFIRSLDMRKVRKESGLFVAEGVSILITAREHGANPETLVYLAGSAEQGLARGLVHGALAAGAECLEVSSQVLGKLAEKDNPQTMMGVFRQRWAAPPAANTMANTETDCAVWLALEEVRDPGNLGTIMRTADAVGAAGVILVGTCCDPFQREAVRATMGSIFAVPLVRMDGPSFLALAQTWPGTVAGTHLEGRQDFRRATYRGPTLIVMGGEGPGLSRTLTDACTDLVKIPMAGQLDSLNLAIATALMLYQVRGPWLQLNR
jgi:RNA methyltransferase, TrmH family